MSDTYTLTTARRAVWSAIEAFPTTASLFRTKFKFDSEIGPNIAQMSEPSGVADMPALSVFPTTITPEWVNACGRDDVYALTVAMWFPGWNLEKPEEAYTAILRALYTAAPEGADPSDTYLKRGTGWKTPAGWGTARVERLKTDNGTGQQAIKFSFDVALKIRQSFS